MTDQLPWYSPQSLRASWKTWWPSLLTVLLALTGSAVLLCWGYGDSVFYIAQPRGEIIRNYGLLIAAFWGVALAVWRSQIASQQTRIANQQANIANQQAKSASRQAETSEQGLRNERYQKGAEMLGSNHFPVRLEGIYALERLARDHPNEYHFQVMDVLSAFARRPVPDPALHYPDANRSLRHPHVSPALDDVSPSEGANNKSRPEIVRVIGRRSNQQIETEKEGRYRINLRDT